MRPSRTIFRCRNRLACPHAATLALREPRHHLRCTTVSPARRDYRPRDRALQAYPAPNAGGTTRASGLGDSASVHAPPSHCCCRVETYEHIWRCQSGLGIASRLCDNRAGDGRVGRPAPGRLLRSDCPGQRRVLQGADPPLWRDRLPSLGRVGGAHPTGLGRLRL